MSVKRIKQEVVVWHCNQCGADVPAQNPDKPPVRCARCQSRRWNEPKRKTA